MKARVFCLFRHGSEWLESSNTKKNPKKTSTNLEGKEDDSNLLLKKFMIDIQGFFVRSSISIWFWLVKYHVVFPAVDTARSVSTMSPRAPMASAKR